MSLVNKKKIENILIRTIFNGGYSINLINNKDNFNTGYFVAINETETKINLTKGTKIRSLISTFIKENKKLLKMPNKILGLWINGKFLYIDVSTQIYSLPESILLGKKFNQLAIWDNKENKEITI